MNRLAKAILKMHMENPDLRVTIFYVTKTQRRAEAYQWLEDNNILVTDRNHPDHAFPVCVFVQPNKQNVADR